MNHSRRGFAPLLIVLFVALAAAGGIVVDRAVQGKLAPPTEAQKQQVNDLGVLFDPVTGGLSSLATKALLGLWGVFATGTAVSSASKLSKSNRALSTLWNAIPATGTDYTNDIPPAALSVIHAVDADVEAKKAKI